MSQPDEITSLNGNKLPVRLSIEYISFSAHVDYQQNSQFIEDVGSKNLVLVHGESNEMGRLKSALNSKYAEREDPIKIFTPRNCETVELFFKGEKMAKVSILQIQVKKAFIFHRLSVSLRSTIRRWLGRRFPEFWW